MLRRTYDDEICSIARALEVIGERWTILIVRDALLGARRFDTFLTNLGLARNVLTDRLNSLVAHGVFERVPYQDKPLRHEYRLTPRGYEITPIILALMWWGDRHFTGENGPPRLAEHQGCGGRLRLDLTCQTCHRPVSPQEVHTRLTQQADRRATKPPGTADHGGGRSTATGGATDS
jgi:DNA-binding HxlR family transcriptional regulator